VLKTALSALEDDLIFCKFNKRMKKTLLSIFIILSFVGYSQNWNVFNKNYRYNYKYDYSPLISNVLFTQTVALSGPDTLYSMNNIGVVNGNSVIPNQAQFLMKKIYKKANGNVELQDPSTITIVPTCSLNQSWIFEANSNLTATCVSTSIELLFSIIDSVKIILLNNADTLKLSKQLV
jgi:hypothetical protein